MKEIKLLMFGVALMSLLVTVTCQEVEMFDTTGFLEDYIDKVLRFNPGNVSFYKLPEQCTVRNFFYNLKYLYHEVW